MTRGQTSIYIKEITDITYRPVSLSELGLCLFEEFNRFQKVEQCWRKEDGEWILRDISFTDDWGTEEKTFLVSCLTNTLLEKGEVLGAFNQNRLVGFASIENNLFGSKKQYLQLSSLHVSYGLRGGGIGKNLFAMICAEAKNRNARKLYISAHSSKETQAFYKKMGCVDLDEADIDKKLFEKEPFDRHLEFDLFN